MVCSLILIGNCVLCGTRDNNMGFFVKVKSVTFNDLNLRCISGVRCF